MTMHGLALRLGALVVAMAAAMGAAQAQQSPRAEQGPAGDAAIDSSPEAQQARALLLEMSQIQERLTEIQRSALESQHELRQQAQQFQDVMVGAMREQGFDPMRSLDHIALIESQLQNKNLNEQEQAGLIAEIQEEQRLLMEAEQTALANPKVQQARQQFLDNLLVAMQKQDPATDQLMNQLAEKNERLTEILATATEEPTAEPRG